MHNTQYYRKTQSPTEREGSGMDLRSKHYITYCMYINPTLENRYFSASFMYSLSLYAHTHLFPPVPSVNAAYIHVFRKSLQPKFTGPADTWGIMNIHEL